MEPERVSRIVYTCVAVAVLGAVPWVVMAPSEYTSSPWWRAFWCACMFGAGWVGGCRYGVDRIVKTLDRCGLVPRRKP